MMLLRTCRSCLPYFHGAKCHGANCQGYCRHVVVGASVFVCVVFVLMLSWRGEAEADVTSFTVMKPRLKSSGKHQFGVSKISEAQPPQPITLKNLEHLLDDDDGYVTSLQEPSPCKAKSVLRMRMNLNTLEDLAQFSGCQRVFYNRVPKCGSRTIISSLHMTSARLNYSLIGTPRPDKRSYFPNMQKLVDFADTFDQYQAPFLYTQHLHFVNFTQLGVPVPLFINVIRDPVERVISHFYYKRYGSNNAPKGVNVNLTLDDCVESGEPSCLPIHQLLPYFCGQRKFCRSNSPDILQKAKQTVSSAYLTVGLTEDLPAFFDVLEVLMPTFFANATADYRKIERSSKNRTMTVKKPQAKPETLQILKDLLYQEYHFYRYVKQRFYALHDKINSLKRERGLNPGKQWKNVKRRSLSLRDGRNR